MSADHSSGHDFTPRNPDVEADPSRLEALRQRFNGALGYLATRDIRHSTQAEHITLHGYQEREVQSQHPLTGEQTTETEIKFPLIPRTHHGHTEFYGPGHSSRLLPEDIHTHTENVDHPFFNDVRQSIAKGDFLHAVRAHTAMIDAMTLANEGSVGTFGRMADRLASDGHKRKDYLRQMYTDTNHAVYREVMSVPNDDIGDGRTWKPELNLRNIQALRTRVMDRWNQPDGDDSQAHSLIRNGGIMALAPDVFAAYLGVDAHALYEQIHSKGKPVIPPQVLTKINFFLQFANDGMPEGELSRELKTLYDGNSFKPDKKSSPVYRMGKLKENTESLQNKYATQLAATRGIMRASLASHPVKRKQKKEAEPKDVRFNPAANQGDELKPATIEVDFHDPVQFGLNYLTGRVNRQGEKKEGNLQPKSRMSQKSFIKAFEDAGYGKGEAESTYRQFQRMGIIDTEHTPGEGFKVDHDKINEIEEAKNKKK